MVVVLELGPLDDQEPHAGEDRFDALAQQRQRMAMAEAGGRPGSVTSTAPAGGRDASAARDAFVERRFDLLLEIVGQLAERGAHLGGADPSSFSSAETSPPLRAR